MASVSLFVKSDKDFDEQADLLKPWKLSDVVLSVEDKKFHVHRSILAICSPFFETLFTSNFKEKHQEEIKLPGNKAAEIQEMLSIIYSNISLNENKVTSENVFFLLELAEEYQLKSLRSLCEKCLIENTTKDKAIEYLYYAQEFKLEQLAEVCIERGVELSLQQIRTNERYSLLDSKFQVRLVEKRVEYLEKKQMGSDYSGTFGLSRYH